ncbi:MAG: hypothetical protein M0D57_02090 [Sphingobacteriales bacterium JAD_PAG50586_3]|nr:MAG: hypothetical protein M0D57_02090 [Sphingobacteriales bacterium JAD_PAG50586_3]
MEAPSAVKPITDNRLLITDNRQLATENYLLYFWQTTMDRIKESVRTANSVAFKSFVFILTVILVVWMFPNSRKFKYEYQKNKP